MLRTTLGLSFILVLGGLAACSSKSTDNGSGGNGSIVGSGGGGGNSAGGTTGNGAGTSNANAGNTSTGGSATPVAGSNGLCADSTITCVDTKQAKGCNPNTGVVETIDCVKEYAELGIESSGCSASGGGEGCDITDFKDAACLDGATLYATCVQGTNEDLLGLYIDCFQDYMGAHTPVTCLADYFSAAVSATDCQNAADACLADLPGAGGAGADPGTPGAGGAP